MSKFKIGDRIRMKKPWWKFWFEPWTLRVVKDIDGQLWLKDPYGAWYCSLGNGEDDDLYEYVND